MYAKFSIAALLVLGLTVSPGFVFAEEDAKAAKPAPAHDPEHNEDHAGDHGHDDHHSIGTKGVDMNPAEFKSDLAIFTFFVFVLLLFILKKFAWGPIVAGLEKREGGIQQQIDDANDAHEKAKALLAKHEYQMDKAQDQVREILAEARRDAEHTREEMIAAAQKETELMKNRAVNDINQARDQALDQLFSHMAKSVAEATEHVLGRTISESDDNKLIDDALAQFAPSKN